MTPDEQETAFQSVLDACDDYLYAQNQLASSLKEGYLLLAKARYSMGHHQVGASQYPSSMQATCLVGAETQSQRFSLIEGSSSLAEADTRCRRPSPAEETTSRQALSEAEGASKDISTEADSADSSLPGPTHSHGHTEYSSLISELADQFNCSDSGGVVGEASSGDIPRKREPLQWFGGLSSPHLRASQLQFSAAIEMAIQLANTKCKLHQQLTNYQEEI